MLPLRMLSTLHYITVIDDSEVVPGQIKFLDPTIEFQFNSHFPLILKE